VQDAEILLHLKRCCIGVAGFGDLTFSSTKIAWVVYGPVSFSRPTLASSTSPATAASTGSSSPPDRRPAMTEDSTGDQAGTVTKLSPRSVPDTVARLTDLLSGKRLKLFAVIDQSAEASAAGLTLRETVLVIFGNPAAGTPVMQAAPLSALDLPLKILVWADGAQTKVTYVAPAALGARYGLTADLTAKLAGIGPLTDALVAS
jgi:uncharacterized protein (DUF302 family)